MTHPSQRPRDGDPSIANGELDAPERSAADAFNGERLALLASTAADLLMVDHVPDEMVRRMFDRVANHLGLEVYVNYLVDTEREGLRLQSCAGIDPERVDELLWLDFGEAVCGTVARSGKRMVIERVQESDHSTTEFIRSLGIRAYACQALVAHGRTIGTLSFGTRERDAFLPDELALLQTVSDLVAAAFDRAALVDSLAGRASALDEIAGFQASLLNSMSQAVIATDRAGRVTAWNQRAEELYGWKAEEAVGRLVYELTVPDTGQERAREIMSDITAGRPWSGEFRVTRRDGSSFIARVSNSPIYDDGSRAIGVISLSEDTTAERLREAAAREEQERRAEWLTFASHELRNALTGIIGYSSRLRRRAASDEQLAPVQEEIDLLAAEARRIERSMELVLKVAALDMGRVSIAQEPLYLADLIGEEIAALAKRDPRVRIDAESLDQSLVVESDDGAIRLIIRNLLENALKYGGDPPIVTVGVDASTEHEVSITVTDNGQGISKEDAPRIFERYFRGAGVSAGLRGLGLGLHISHRLAELLHGSLVTEDGSGAGARFRLTIPRSIDAASD